MTDRAASGEKEFNAASTWLSSAPSAAALPNEIKLELYGLFKYINTLAGPTGSRPSIFSPAPRAKYDAWAAQYTKYSSKGDEGKQLAQQRYIEIALQIGWSNNVPNDEEDDVDLENLDDEPIRNKGKGRDDNPIGGVKVSVMSGDMDEDDHDTHPLHLAVSENEVPKVESLLKQDKSLVHLRDEFGYTPLHLAADRGHIEMTKLLLRHGADKEAEDGDSQTPLQLAEISGRDEIVELLKPI
ncbi:hypothetical protein I203_105393 [Kwoniella mangroviensis CBS 8507]|uniref:uncharacterized protein n=1 Tax=Kwoniella mangroviensis CBS 8507 TaxID=1296122 RepID=UPI00080D5CB7|nr:uncharacterized protein I203_01210 [Kwoniella mangroviensis CBS 8507]OCF69353.1 hypothetical protein I203_01210 [Kwoniella mangroviensis CBS 8507]